MAKQTCASCGAEVGLIGQVKLADGNYLCRKNCAKKTMKRFDFMHGTLPLYNDHVKQIEEGTRIYESLFIKRKPKPKWVGGLLVSEDLGLVAWVDTWYKILLFGKTQRACVFRIADLYAYEYEKGTKMVYDSTSKKSAPQTTHYMRYYFWDSPGVSDFVRVINPSKTKKIQLYYNKLFGIQKTLGNIGATWKNQIGAIKAVGSAAKAAVSGDENVEAKAGEAAAAMDRMQYGDRTEWKAKADAALAAFK